MTTQALTEGAIMAGITTLLGVLSYYVPFLMLLAFVWPIPIVILGKRHGIEISILSTIAATGVLAIVINPMYAVQLGLMFGLLGITLGYAYQKEMSIPKTILLGYIVALISIVLILQFYNLLTGINFIDEITQMVEVSLEQYVNIFRESGMDQSLIDETITQAEDRLRTMIQLFPMALLIIPVIITILNMFLSEKLLKRLGYEVKKIPPFWNWALPNHASFGLFGMVLLVALGQYLGIEKFDMVYFNLLSLIFFTFFVQGLAVVAYYFHQRKVSKAFWIIGFILIQIMPLLTTFVQFLGLFDVLFHFRDRIRLG